MALPFGIAPTGFTRLMQTEGEIAARTPPPARTSRSRSPRWAPGWWFDLLTTEPLSFASLDRWPGTVAEYLDTMFDPTVTFEDLAWIKKQWPNKLVAKGIQTLKDARGGEPRRRRHRAVQRWRSPAVPGAGASPPAAACRG